MMVIILSIINYESDLAKFLFAGYSSTYDVTIIRYSPFLVITLAVIAILLSIARKFINIIWIKYAMIFTVVLWVFSMRTTAYVDTDGTLISGWSFIRIYSCKCSTTEERIKNESKVENCEIDFDPFLDRKLKNKLKLK